MSSAQDPEVLERNLERLFARSYEPVEASPRFRNRLRLVLEAEIGHRGKASTGTRRGIAWRVAAAILVLLGGSWIGWTVFQRPAVARGVEEILAAGLPALREAPTAVWRALTVDEIERGVDLAVAAIDLATPDRPSLRPVRLGIEPEGEMEAEADSRVSARRAESSEIPVEIAFEAGAIALERRELPGAWRIATSEGDLFLKSGRLELAYVALIDGPRLRARLLSGAAELGSASPLSLPIGREVLILDGSVLGEPAIDEPAKAPERASAATTEKPEAPPAPSKVVPVRGKLILPETDPLPESFVVTLLRAKRLPEVSEPMSRTFTGTAGAFELEKLKPGSYSVFVQVEGYAVWVKRGVEISAGSTLELQAELDRGVALRGRVLDAEGKPVEGALVLAEEDTPVQVLDLALRGADPSWPAAALTDSEGVFHLPHLLPGRKTLRATRSGHGAGWIDGVDPASIDPADPQGGAVVRLTKSGAIEGRVAHDDGTPWPEAFVIVSFMDSTFQRPCMSFAHAVAGADGRYAAEDLPPGSYVVFNASEAGLPGGPAMPRILQARVEPGARVELDLPGKMQGTSVEGRIVTADGAPVKDLDVMLVRSGDDQSWKAVRSGDDGSFRFPDFAPGAYDVFVGEELGDQFVLQERIEVPAVPTFKTTITLASGALTGKVTSAATGAGLPKSVVVVEIESQGPNGKEFRFAGKSTSDAQGSYQFLRLPPGRYRVAAYATSGRFGPGTREGVEVPGARIDFALDAGAALTVRVTDAAGRAVQGARLAFTSPSGASLALGPDETTDANGIFRALGVNPGRWTVSATREPQGRAETSIDLEAGEERALELKLASNR